MTPTMSSKFRFAATLALLFALQVAVLGVFMLFLSLDAGPAQRALLLQLLAQNAAMLAVLAVALLLILGFSLNALSAAYVTSVDQLAEEVGLLAANPRYRLRPQGARPLRALVAKLNHLAAANQALREDGQAQVDAASRALSEQRNRLAALMSDLTLSVLVCNVDGRILLYNRRAIELLGASGRISSVRSARGRTGRTRAGTDPSPPRGGFQPPSCG
jgi:DNA polymerase III subunit epsilon